MGAPCGQHPAETGTNDIRCSFCNKLLAKSSLAYVLEIKCPRCGSLNTILEGMSEQIAITDPDGKILYMNQAMERETGYSAIECLGKRTSELWGSRVPAQFYADMWRLMRADKKTFRSSLTKCRKTGEFYNVDLAMSPVLDPCGAIIFYVGIEVTKKKDE